MELARLTNGPHKHVTLMGGRQCGKAHLQQVMTEYIDNGRSIQSNVEKAICRLILKW